MNLHECIMHSLSTELANLHVENYGDTTAHAIEQTNLITAKDTKLSGKMLNNELKETG